METSKIALLGKTLYEIQQITANLGMPKFAAKQIASWLYDKKVDSIDEMTNLHLLVGFRLPVGDHLAEILRLGFLEPEELHESLDALGRNVALALQNLYQEARIHVDRSGEHAVAERRVQRLFQFVELLQKLAVVGIVVYVDLVFRKHGGPAGINIVSRY